MPPLVPQNGVIKEAIPLRKRPVQTWTTVWPFVILYLIQAYVYLDAETVWGRLTYLVWQKYIDFFHATCWPVLFFIHGFAMLFTVWSVRIKRMFLFSDATVETATHVLVITQPHKGESQMIPVMRDFKTKELWFVFQKRKWKYDAAEKKQFNKPHFPTKLTFKEYAAKKDGLTTAAQFEALDSYGKNRLEIEIPDFATLFVDHALAPFFVFQMFCVLLWCLDEYWMYSLFTGFMMAGLEATQCMQRINNMKSLRAMGEVPVNDITVIRNGKGMVVKSTELLPLDLIEIPMNKPCPADVLIVGGGVVVNEAMLTGESTPQIKESVDPKSDTQLSMKRHTRHIVFSGTEVITSTPAAGTLRSLATGLVLKSGFETKQGKLLRTILHSQSRISENSGEAFAFIAFLLVFAVAAVGYLLQRGLSDPSRSRWKLALHCTQIITAVVPPELPMELSLAVNTSLIALVKLKVFCTEPFRIPFAGKVDTCCFDKTGTLTTDEMVFAGLDEVDGNGVRAKVKDLSQNAVRVLCGCHSLVHVDGELAGDAMEQAAVKALSFKRTSEDVFSSKDDKTTLSILSRFNFDPDLRRMSCLLSDNSTSQSEKVVVCKGSPESLASLLTHKPDGYDTTVSKYTAQGLRVIALGCRVLRGADGSKSSIATMTRENAERDLEFVGFAIFQCPLKKDTVDTIQNLMHGSHRCTIITGDNVQTALSVGKDVGMAIAKTQLVARAKSADSDALEWVPISAEGTLGEPVTQSDADLRRRCTSSENLKKVGTSKDRVKAIAKFIDYDLCVNAETLTSSQFAASVAQFGDYVTIWARCQPSQKEDIVSHLKSKGRVVLMAGDGTNDVGGLKQAHVGIAVLNSAAVEASVKAAKNGPQSPGAAGPGAAPGLPPPPGPNAGIMEKAKYEALKQQHAAREMQRTKAEQLAKGEFPVTPLPPKPDPKEGFWAMAKWETAKRQHDKDLQAKKAWEERRAKEKAAGKSGAEADEAAVKALTPNAATSWLPTDSDFSTSSLFNDDMDDSMGAPITKLGDASIAAPFTCKSKKMMAICDIVRLGRSTLVTTLQMYKILALNCLVSAYSMSVLHSDGVKLGDKQMMVTGVVLSICFLCMSRSQPLERLAPQRPITQVFHPYMICSILGQFALHLYSMKTSVDLVFTEDAEGVITQRSEVDKEDFKPTLLNTVMFLMSTMMTVTTFAVNYRGEPFMQPLKRNRPLYYSLIGLTILVFYIASEVDPDTNLELEIVKFPNDEFRTGFLQLLLTDALGAFAIDRICLWTMTELR